MNPYDFERLPSGLYAIVDTRSGAQVRTAYSRAEAAEVAAACWRDDLPPANLPDGMDDADYLDLVAQDDERPRIPADWRRAELLAAYPLREVRR